MQLIQIGLHDFSTLVSWQASHPLNGPHSYSMRSVVTEAF